jgi:uncharacterized protein
MQKLKYIFFPITIIGFFFLSYLITSLYPNLLWFDSFGYASIWWFIIKSKITVFLSAFIISFIWLYINLKIALKISDVNAEKVDLNIQSRFSFINQLFSQIKIDKPESVINKIPNRLYRLLLLLGITFFSFILALSVKLWWQDIFLFLNRTATGLTDPILGKDISFYFFILPLVKNIHAWFFILLIITLGLSLWIYFSKNILLHIFAKDVKNTHIKKHIFFLLGLFFCLIVAKQWVNMYELLLSPRGVVFGAGYTDIYAQLISYKALIVLFAIEAALLFIWAFKKSIKVPLFFFAFALVTSILLGAIYPKIVQEYFVAPNELQKETPYIKHNINYTKIAYGLDKIQEASFPASNTLSYEDIKNNPNVINNIRLWNQIPLKQTFSQLQEIRLYYEFLNVDVDRYEINNQLQQVMLSPREMDSSQISAKAQNWINSHLTYTHGYGLCMSPVNEITDEGLPYFLIKDLPPNSSIGVDIIRPEIYFGEKKILSYVIANTKQKEFNYPKGDKNVYASYEGNGGIILDGITKRFIFSLKFSDPKILISSLITSESRIMYDRDIKTIVKKIAPFLIFDRDPYLVLTKKGTMVWMLDAYTVSSSFPYSEPYKKSINYIRNSVKVTIDAYSGKTNFYIIDNSDSIIRSFAKVYKNLFKNIDAMPLDLQEHIRYPKDLFSVQSHMYCTYHMNDPQVFYNKEDVWAIPFEKYEENEQLMDSYYTITKLPEEENDAFILMRPFTPTNKNNMIAWLSAKCDRNEYGQLKVFKLPKEKTIYGPMQIESRIDQNTDISKSLTLWGQGGSRVIRGNIMVIPIEKSLIYVEPIYLQATQSKLPELKRVIFAYDNSVVMGKNIHEAINLTFEKETIQQETKQVVSNISQKSKNYLSDTINKIANEFKAFKNFAKQNDWVNFGKKLNNIDLLLDNLVLLHSSLDSKESIIEIKDSQIDYTEE